MAIVRGNTQTITANGAPGAVTKPTGLADGDVLITAMGTSAASGTPPSGFTTIGSATTSASERITYAYKVVTSAAGEPANYSWSGASGRTSVAITAYSGVDTTTPVDMTAATATGTASVGVSNTTVTDGAMLIAGAIGDWSSAGMTVPGSMSQVFNLGNPGRRTAGADLIQATAGATGTLTFTGESGLSMAGIIFALRPTAGAVLGEGSATGAIAWVGEATGTNLVAPTLTATAVSDTQINLSWSAVSGATSYDIERDDVVIVTGHGTTSYSDTGLTPSTLYTYRVRGVA
jgi:hypothetical protein